MKTSSRLTTQLAVVVAAAVAGVPLPVIAADFKLGDDIEGKLSATVTAGTAIRTEAADPAVFGTLSAARVGLAPGQLGGSAGSSDLNFQKNRAVSTVVKGFADLELKRGAFGAFVRAMAWRDFELADGDRAYGNYPNGFQQNVPLSDAGFDAAAKFSNIMFTEAYVFGKSSFSNDTNLDVRVGRQSLNWGTSQFVGGGLSAINAQNLPAQGRPGALPQEARIPLSMVAASLAGGKQWAVEGFLPWEFRPSVLPGCGTFLTTANFAPIGCNFVQVLSGAPFLLNDPAALTSGRYPKRTADVLARDSGQYGLSARYTAMSIDTEFRGYVANYHSRSPSIRVTNPNINGGFGALATTRLTDPNGIRYGMLYAEDIKMYGVTFDTRIDPSLRVYGELAYRPSQPLNLNASDLIAAFLTRGATTALNLAKRTNTLPVGATFDGYDRFKVTTGNLGLGKVFTNALGAERVTLSGEIAWSHVSGLPDPGSLRYGRSDDYGTAAVNGAAACVDTTAAKKSCALEGFVTANSWGYRLRASAAYSNVLFGATLTPSLGFNHDVEGYSYDGTFLKDRKVLRPAIRADWRRQYFAEIAYNRISGGTYNNLVDRDTVALVIGANF